MLENSVKDFLDFGFFFGIFRFFYVFWDFGDFGTKAVFYHKLVVEKIRPTSLIQYATPFGVAFQVSYCI